ncbi:hypothetical protein [Planomonospora venezuelensis]|uniref:Uncharacterized protein n=1 Tax=Planomonospora venezuelensis TaxID=1999 RepID=A0A841CX82_PLAVE|nr:hypothetical protein [Planomonospora venezuelensis]MBB5962531.1 hypothetical protein [Planomonospora venezuelensis]GIM99066.1 hypothetical protein Pve01_07250 [Planomonospora venezuelensis]
MKYVDLNASMTLSAGDAIHGVISPFPYLERLPEFADALPAGARAFAADRLHYDFHGPRCVKDLNLERIAFGETGGESFMELAFRHNCWKHEEDLVIRYDGVSDYRLDIAAPSGVEPRSVVILDEILPHPDGCSHEIAFRPGTVTVVCRDLTATWVEADCPEKQPQFDGEPDPVLHGGQSGASPDVRVGAPQCQAEVVKPPDAKPCRSWR